jgi:nucleotide-binding universal stress UspA family protein
VPAREPEMTVVAGVDDRPASEDALALARLLARPFDARVLAAHVVRPGEHGGPEPVVQARRIEASSPAKGLHELADAEGARVIAVGSTDRGTLGRIYPGSVAERLLSGGPCAVAVAPRGYAKSVADRLRVIEVGFDGAAESRRALDAARALALATGATMRIFAVFETGGGELTPIGVDAKDRLARELKAAVDDLPDEIRPLDRLVDGDPAGVLTAEAEAGVDLLVLGSRSYGPLQAALLGGVSSKVMRTAPCPVLVVPRAGDPAPSP